MVLSQSACAIAHRPANNTSRVQVDEHRQVQPTVGGRDVADVLGAKRPNALVARRPRLDLGRRPQTPGRAHCRPPGMHASNRWSHERLCDEGRTSRSPASDEPLGVYQPDGLRVRAHAALDAPHSGLSRRQRRVGYARARPRSRGLASTALGCARRSSRCG